MEKTNLNCVVRNRLKYETFTTHYAQKKKKKIQQIASFFFKHFNRKLHH